MVDLLFSVLEALLETGMPSPDRLEDQRKARLVASLFALATAAVIQVYGWQTSSTGQIVMIVAALGAGWIVLFSTVDIVKEAGRSRWWSISACLVGTATLTLTSFMLVR
jgi:hypothetical protein